VITTESHGGVTMPELVSKHRRLTTRLPNPPKLEAVELLWLGVGLFVVGVIAEELLNNYLSNHGPALLMSLPRVLFNVPLTLDLLGVTLVAVAFGVRSLSYVDARDPTLSDD
jgi:hypothetical protein